MRSLLLAVSETSDPTGNWFRNQIRVDLTDGVYASSPSLGLGRDWVIVSAVVNDKTGLFFFSADVFVFNRTNLYAGSGALAMALPAAISSASAPCSTKWPPACARSPETRQRQR